MTILSDEALMIEAVDEHILRKWGLLLHANCFYHLLCEWHAEPCVFRAMRLYGVRIFDTTLGESRRKKMFRIDGRRR